MLLKSFTQLICVWERLEDSLLEEDEVSDELLIVNEGPCDVECAAPSSGRSVDRQCINGQSLLDQSYCNLTIIEPLLGELNSKGTSLLPLAWTALKTAFWRVLAKTESFVPRIIVVVWFRTSTVAQVAAPATVEENVSGQNSMDISTSGFVLEPSS